MNYVCLQKNTFTGSRWQWFMYSLKFPSRQALHFRQRVVGAPSPPPRTSINCAVWLGGLIQNVIVHYFICIVWTKAELLANYRPAPFSQLLFSNKYNDSDNSVHYSNLLLTAWRGRYSFASRYFFLLFYRLAADRQEYCFTKDIYFILLIFYFF